VRISEADASVLLSEDGRAILATVDILVESLCWLEIDVVESEELGLWIRVERAGKMHFLLLRWDFILAIDVEQQARRAVGLKSVG
jgi:hypothetical protein